jgi:hypothetical protein
VNGRNYDVHLTLPHPETHRESVLDALLLEAVDGGGTERRVETYAGGSGQNSLVPADGA